MSPYPGVSTLVLVLVLLVPAQDDPARMVQAQRQEASQLASSWLESDDPRRRAWAAFLVGRDELVALLPRLRALVQQSMKATARYTRVVGPPESEVSGPDLRCGFGSWVSRDNVRPAFLTRLAGVSTDRLNPVERRTLTWLTDAQYLRDLRAVVAGQRTLIAELVGRLVKNGALTEEEPLGTQPTILVTVSDARGGVRRRPLPIPGGDGKLVRFEANVSD